jgi:ABC-type nitrate/sulfonate/bicarbonate transport system substrate-binding protein
MKPAMLLFALAVTCLMGCRTLPGNALPTTAPARPSVLRVELPNDPEIPDIARAMTVEAMRELGYTVETVELNDNTQSMQALEQGDLDIGNVNIAIGWSAIQQGAKSITILDDRTDLPILLATEGIQKCSDLDRKRVGVSSLTSTQALMIEQYVAQECPGVRTELPL